MPRTFATTIRGSTILFCGKAPCLPGRSLIMTEFACVSDVYPDLPDWRQTTVVFHDGRIPNQSLGNLPVYMENLFHLG